MSCAHCECAAGVLFKDTVIFWVNQVSLLKKNVYTECIKTNLIFLIVIKRELKTGGNEIRAGILLRFLS